MLLDYREKKDKTTQKIEQQTNNCNKYDSMILRLQRLINFSLTFELHKLAFFESRQFHNVSFMLLPFTSIPPERFFLGSQAE